MIAISHLGDLHADWGFAEKALTMPPGHGLIALSGDLCNFEGKRSAQRVSGTQKALQDFIQKAQHQEVHVAVCSGNHENWLTPFNHDIHWLRGKKLHCTGDTETQLLNRTKEKVIVTCIPWRDSEELILMHSTHGIMSLDLEDEEIERNVALATLLQGAKLKTENPEALWICLHHNPPSFSQLSKREEASNVLSDWIETYQPDLVLCGHIHTPPQAFERFGKTLASNPGRGAETVGLNQIIATRQGSGWEFEVTHRRL